MKVRKCESDFPTSTLPHFQTSKLDSMATQPNVIATWILLLIYAGVVGYFVWRGAKRTRSMSDYALGSLAFSPVAVGLSLAASMTSAATFIINPGLTAYYGISGVLSMAIVLPLAALVSLIVFTKGFRRHGQVVKALSMAQWIGTRYGSRRYALFFAFLAFLLITFIVLICVGITKVLALSLNADEVWVLLGVVIFVFGYMMFGGANSMVYTNAIQASLMLVVAFILLGSGAEHFTEGIQGFLQKLRDIDPLLATSTNPKSPLFRDFFEIIFCQIVIGVAIVCQPHIITKSLLLKSESDVNRYLITGLIVELIFFLVVIAGLYARIEFPELQGGSLGVDGVMSAYVVQEFSVENSMGAGLQALMLALGLVVVLGLIFAGISTLEGLIQSLSTTITADILEPLFGKQWFVGEKSESHKVLANKLVIVGLAVLSFLFSYQQLVNPNLSVAIFAQNGVYAYFSAAFIPVLFGTFWKRVPMPAVFAASVTAILVHFGTYYGGWPAPYLSGAVRNPAVAATLAILAAFVVSLLVTFLYKPSKVEKA
jgi:sodium/pantothenate symporter